VPAFGWGLDPSGSGGSAPPFIGGRATGGSRPARAPTGGSLESSGRLGKLGKLGRALSGPAPGPDLTGGGGRPAAVGGAPRVVLLVGGRSANVAIGEEGSAGRLEVWDAREDGDGDGLSSRRVGLLAGMPCSKRGMLGFP